jgi:hypothetical protein
LPVTIWSAASFPDLPRLAAIAATGATDVWAVGGYTPDGTTDRPLIDHYSCA